MIAAGVWLRVAGVLGLVCCSSAHGFGLAAASVEFVTGEARVVGKDGAARAALSHVRVFSGETVATGRNSRVVLRFSDGGTIALQADSRLRIEDYRFSGRVDGDERSYLSLLRGGLRAVTGLIGHYAQRNFRLITPTATIGVRGTEYALRYTDRLIAAVTEGEIELCNGSGCRSASRGEAYYVSAPDAEAVLVAGPDVPPTPAVPSP